MKENKKRISLVSYIISLIVMLVVIIVLICYILQNRNNNKETNISNSNISDSGYLNNENTIVDEQQENINAQQAQKLNNYFILYNGYEMKIQTGIQDLSDMKINSETKLKYNTTYYNYENGKYVGETKGTFGEETFEGLSVVNNIKRIAISQQYNAIPRTYTTINELPEQLIDMADYSSVNIQSIDLDNDGKTEYIVCYTINYAQGEIGNGQPQASSGLMVLDYNYKKIADIVSLENGFWGDIKKEDKKIFISLDDVDYIDIDNDEIIEMIIKIPTYEGTKIDIIKYNRGNIEGETNIKASVLP